MLYVLLDAGTDTYAVASASVVEVVPFASLKSAPGAPRSVAGILNYRGSPVPVVDCGILLAGTPSPVRFSTRIILQRLAIGGRDRVLGLLGGNVTRVQAFEESDFVGPGARAVDFPCAGRIAPLGDRWIQRLDTASVLTEDVWEALTSEEA
jgi:chemotaxis-related protein WspB